MKRLISIGLFIVVVFLYTGCSLLDPAIPVPSYIHVDSIHLSIPTADKATQGTSSSKITDAWIYVNDQLVGVFEMPCTVPVLANGNSSVSVDAGIKISGISANRGQYPFYNQYNSSSVALSAGKITKVQPVVNYMAQTKFTWSENFEGVQCAFTTNPLGTTDTVIKFDTARADVFEGRASGVVNLVAGPTAVQFEGVSSPATGFALPSDGTTPVYIELNYKSNNSFTVGVYGGSTSIDFSTPIPVLNINPTPTWNKIYINLTQTLVQVPSPYYVVYFYMTPDVGIANPKLLIDNIKLVHF